MSVKSSALKVGRFALGLVRVLSRCALVLAFVAVGPLGAAPVSPEIAAKIDRLFAKWDHKDTPGVIVAIALDGETIFSRAYGMANWPR